MIGEIGGAAAMRLLDGESGEIKKFKEFRMFNDGQPLTKPHL